MGGHHEHDHGPGSYGRIFALGIALNLGFVVAEWVAGMMAGSLALLADAGHNLSDVLGLVLAWTAYALGRRKPCGTARLACAWPCKRPTREFGTGTCKTI